MLFGHLAAQGHVVVDVTYRLFPETDVPGMVGDAKRAVAWVREHATELEVVRKPIVAAAARVAFYALERFLAVISTTEKGPLMYAGTHGRGGAP